MTWTCPCCGAAVEGRPDPATIIAALPLTLLRRRLCGALADRFGTFVSMQHLADVVYGDDPNGGPDEAAGVLRQFIHQERPKLRKHGLAIEAHGPNVGYRMIWADDAPAETGRGAA